MASSPDPKMWTCRKCKTDHVNLRLKKCLECGTARRKKRHPKHQAVLNTLTYEDFIALNGGEFCGICNGKRKEGGKRLHRDHVHKGLGTPRGLLCFQCNSRLDYRSTPAWHRAAADYLERAA